MAFSSRLLVSHFLPLLLLLLRAAVAITGGDPTARRLWQAICEVSRNEFEKVYSRLGVTLREMGESAYNDMLPSVIGELAEKGSERETRKATEKQNDPARHTARVPAFGIPLVLLSARRCFHHSRVRLAVLLSAAVCCRTAKARSASLRPSMACPSWP